MLGQSLYTTPYSWNRKQKSKSPLLSQSFKIVNADGFGFISGLKPDYALKEDYGNLDVLEILLNLY
jgi:hypothetical protein